MELEYLLVGDNDCHWYIIPRINEEEWREWLDLHEDDEKSWTPPDFAKRIDGPHRIALVDWREI